MYSSRSFGSLPSSLPMTLWDLNARICCLISMLALAFNATGRKFFVTADFFSASKSFPQSVNNFFATSRVTHERCREKIVYRLRKGFRCAEEVGGDKKLPACGIECQSQHRYQTADPRV